MEFDTNMVVKIIIFIFSLNNMYRYGYANVGINKCLHTCRRTLNVNTQQRFDLVWHLVWHFSNDPKIKRGGGGRGGHGEFTTSTLQGITMQCTCMHLMYTCMHVFTSFILSLTHSLSLMLSSSQELTSHYWRSSTGKINYYTTEQFAFSWFSPGTIVICFS